MREFHIGGHVVWVSGVYGIFKGTVVGFIDIPGSEPPYVVEVETPLGRFCEYPHNLKVLVN